MPSAYGSAFVLKMVLILEISPSLHISCSSQLYLNKDTKKYVVYILYIH